MIEKTSTPSAPRKHRWLRGLGFTALILVLLLVIAYFVGTSSMFLKSVILPKVSKSLNAQVTVSDASIHPFKEVTLHNLKVEPNGAEPLLVAPEVHLRYSLMDIIGGNIHVEDLTISSPVITLVQHPDGTSNLDPILNAQKNKPAKEKEPSSEKKKSKPAQLDLKKFALTDATVRHIKNYSGGKSESLELLHVNLTAQDFKNGQTGKLALSADLKIDRNPQVAAEVGSLSGKATGNFSVGLTSDLQPSTVQGNIHMAVTKAEGALADAATFAGDVDCDVTPKEVKNVSLRFQKGATALGELRVSGPLDLQTKEGKLTIVVANMGKDVFNLAGGGKGLKFTDTTFSSTNEVQLTKAGTMFTLAGRLDLAHLQVTQTNQTTPVLDLGAQYQIAVDQGASSATIQQFSVSGKQAGADFLKGGLDKPMLISWGTATSSSVGDSALTVTVNDFKLSDWKAFMGENPPNGVVNVKATLLSQQAGKLLSFDVGTEIKDFSVAAGSNQIDQAQVVVKVQGKATELKKFNLDQYSLVVSQKGENLATVSGTGLYDTVTTNLDLQLTAQATLARLLAVMPQKDASISAGTVEAKMHVTQAQGKNAIAGNLAINDLTGKFGKNDFRAFFTKMDLDVGMTPQAIQIRKATGQIGEQGKPGGTFDLSGSYDQVGKSAQFTAKLEQFNETGLRPFLEPMLAEKKLQSISLGGAFVIQYNPQGETAFKGDLQVSNLVVLDPQNSIPATPLEASAHLDAGMQKQIAELRSVQLNLTPTERAKNELKISGRVDMTQTNAYQGNLTIASDSMDVTRYYDLFAGDATNKASNPPKATGTTTSRRATSTSTSTDATTNNGQQEPDKMDLPVRDFTAQVNIGRFYLREVAITNLQTTIKIASNSVVINPMQLSLNGAPVNLTANLDLSVPGYKYDTRVSMVTVPLAPLVNSFQPDRKGKVNGTLTATANIKGQGTTGANLQKYLEGKFDAGSTNLNLDISQLKSPLLKKIVNVIAIVPELAKSKDLTSAAGSLAGALVGSKSGPAGKGGWADELAKSPINVIQATGDIGAGKVNLSHSAVQSPAFQAEAKGTISIAEVLTNSAINIPLSILVRRGLAESVNLVPANTPTNAVFVKLPDYVTIKGTVGKPDEKINYAALAGSVVQGLTGAGVGGKAGNVLQGLGGLLNKGNTPAPTPAPGPAPEIKSAPAPRPNPGALNQSPQTKSSQQTNAPSSGASVTNRPATNTAVDTLLDLFNRPKKKQ